MVIDLFQQELRSSIPVPFQPFLFSKHGIVSAKMNGRCSVVVIHI